MHNKRQLGVVYKYSYSCEENPENIYSLSPKCLRYKAHKLTKKPVFWQYFMKDVYPEIKEYANIYSKQVKDKLIVLGNDENDEVFKIRYITRFSNQYPEMVKKKLKKVYRVFSRYNKFLFMTITVDPKQFTSLNDAYKYLGKLWNKVYTRLRKRYSNISVIKTVEMQKNGYPHLHILIAGIGFLPREWLLKTKEMGFQFFKLEYLNGYDYKGAVNYILKYILKGSTNNNNDAYMQRVIQWALFIRTYSTSRLSLNTMKNNSNEKTQKIHWFILGFINEYDISDEIKTKSDFLYEKYKGIT